MRPVQRDTLRRELRLVGLDFVLEPADLVVLGLEVRGQVVDRALHLAAHLGDLGSVGQAVVLDSRRLAVEIQGLERVLRDPESLLVEVGQVHLAAGELLRRRLLVPRRRRDEVGLAAQSLFKDLADVNLGLRIALFGLRHPHRERRRVVRPVVRDILAAADLAIDRDGLDRPPGGQVRHLAAELADLAGQQAVDDQEPARILRDRLLGRGDRRCEPRERGSDRSGESQLQSAKSCIARVMFAHRPTP